jgi:peroxisomal biogenesis factor 11 (PEX11)
MDAMGIWGTTWGRDILIEANRFWFYSLILSLCCSLWTLSARSNNSNRRSSSDHPTAEKTQQPQRKSDEKEKQPSSAPVVKQIVVDSFDLLIPGAFVGWIAASPVQVGLATIISTVVTARDIWIQAQPAA